MNEKIKKLCYTALGIALFVVLSMCVRVPVFENYYICLGYVAMAVYCYSFGPITGTLVGTLGVILYCLLTNGLRGMPGWTAGNVVIGFMLGLVFRITRQMQKPAIKLAINAAAIVVSVAIGILGIKSIVESLLYAQPFIVRIAKNSYAFVADVITLLISLPVCMILDKYLKKKEE